MMQPKVDCLSESDAKRLADRQGHAVTETRFVSASVGRRVRWKQIKRNKDGAGP